MIGAIEPLLASFIGPTSAIPFGRPIEYTVVVGVFLWSRIFLNHAGFYHTYLPKTPHKSYVPHLVKSAMMSARMLDCLTDMAFARVLFHEVRMPWLWGDSGLH